MVLSKPLAPMKYKTTCMIKIVMSQQRVDKDKAELINYFLIYCSRLRPVLDFVLYLFLVVLNCHKRNYFCYM